ncbi:MAG TPA: protein-methionine-sulfoxide reductase catalytic subunit MsrP, partial [Candidatus Omnitrophota bacterium]|nr:protein-methionine-sulfoxide reductase catalytic subunit MsrP [Candidatus Omnitrophota bacterium]
MLIRRAAAIRESEVTDHRLYLDRRRFLALGAASAVTAWVGRAEAAEDKPTPFEAITTYNNFYEFGTDKEDPAKHAPGRLKTRPWSVAVEGACARPGVLAFDDLIKPHKVEERIYRLRCVEGWSMVIPWMGVPLADVLKRFEPTSNAKFVEFTTLADPDQMPGVKSRVLDWPYVEGLRMDEAMHPLTLLAVGLY